MLFGKGCDVSGFDPATDQSTADQCLTQPFHATGGKPRRGSAGRLSLAHVDAWSEISHVEKGHSSSTGFATLSKSSSHHGLLRLLLLPLPHHWIT